MKGEVRKASDLGGSEGKKYSNMANNRLSKDKN
jgi:hypothetical protein